MMAGCTNGMVETAEPQIADVDGMTLLGGGPVQRVGGVDEGNEEREPQTYWVMRLSDKGRSLY